MRKIKNLSILRDLLYNLAPDSGASNDYCQGLLVGCVSALVAQGWTLRQAIAVVAIHTPNKAGTRLNVPESWRQDFMVEYIASHPLKAD